MSNYFLLNYKINYETYNNNCPRKEHTTNNIISAKDNKITIQPMWRMELLGQCYNINISAYRENVKWNPHDDLSWSFDPENCSEKDRKDYNNPFKYDEYFERLAHLAAKLGCERAEIKCLIKSLILKYNTVEYIGEFPHSTFNKLINRLIKSQDREQYLVAIRLKRYHIMRYKKFLH